MKDNKNKPDKNRIKQNEEKGKEMSKNITLCKNHLFKIIFDYAPDGYCLIDLEGNIIKTNNATQKITGYCRDELIGKNCFQLGLLSEHDILKVHQSIKKTKKGFLPDQMSIL